MKNSLVMLGILAGLLACVLSIISFNTVEMTPQHLDAGRSETRNALSPAEIRAYVATLTGNSIRDCLARQLGTPELNPGIVHSTEPCPVRNAERGHLLRTFFFGKDRLPAPYVQAGDLPRSGPDAKKSITVYLIGGPLVHADDNLANLPVLQGLPEQAVWVFPLYKGTGFRASSDGGVDLRLAIREVSALAQFLRREYPNARIDVIGDSFGALIAARIDHASYDRLILLSPPLTLKGQEFESYFGAITSARKRNFDTTFVSVDYSTRQMPIKLYPYIVSAGHALKDEDLVPQMGIRSDCALLIFGKRDRLFSPEWVRGKPLFSRFTQVISLDWGHGIMTDATTRALTQKAIRDFECDAKPAQPAPN